jgi:hypothetical protein
MKIAVHLTERVCYEWPLAYWVELVRKLTDAGHDLYALSDEPNVTNESKNPKFHDRLHLSDDESRKVIADCELFIGPPLKYYDMAKDIGVRTIALLGATLKGDGVQTTAICGGCLDKLENKNDCIFEDELCYWELSPNDVISAI